MKFYYADSIDQVDPDFNFISESYGAYREGILQKHDRYAHELMSPQRPYDGLLVSRFTFDSSTYNDHLRQEAAEVGIHRLLRFGSPEAHSEFPIIADCGAFNYFKEANPIYTTDDMIEFYERYQFTYGVSIDHIIAEFRMPDHSQLVFPGFEAQPEAESRRRYEITLKNAEDFYQLTQGGRAVKFDPIGVVQGWDPESYADAVMSLKKMGYTYVALGGMVTLRTPEILAVLEAIKARTGGSVPLHLFGISRLINYQAFKEAGVISFDSTSPLRQAFLSSKDNYHSDAGHYAAIRIRQTSASTELGRKVRDGVLDRELVIKHEREALEAMRQLDQGHATVDQVLNALHAYEEVCGGEGLDWKSVRRTLEDKPWQSCPCNICKAVGVEVIILRGNNRNRRRGFHNLWYTQQTLNCYRADEAPNETSNA